MGLIGVLAAISVPTFIESNARNRLWTASEQIGGTIRQTRLKAISRNTSYRVVFDCPAAGSLRSLVLTGDLHWSTMTETAAARPLRATQTPSRCH